MTWQKELVSAAKPQLMEMATNIRANFMDKFGTQVQMSHHEQINELLKKALEAEAEALACETADEARQWAEVSADAVRSIETLTLGAMIIADAKAHSFFMETVSTVLETFKGVAAGVLKTVISSVISGGISGLTGGAGDLIGGIASAAGTFLASES
jgi:hypothetical protein